MSHFKYLLPILTGMPLNEAEKDFSAPILLPMFHPERRSQLFVKEDDGFRVNTAIREMVVFAPQNVIKDPPFTKMDLLLCRNLLIYIESELQTKLMKLKKQVLDTSEPVTDIILFNIKKTVSYHIAAQPIRDKQGNITGVSTCASECLCEKLLYKTKES